jgi:integrase
MGCSLGERPPSSPNCRVSAGVKARHPSSCKLLTINDLERNGHGDWRFCVTFCVTFLAPLPMSTPTGLFERNGHYYLRLIIPTHQRHLFNGRTRIVQSLNTCHKRQAIVAATLLRAEILSTLFSQGRSEQALTRSNAIAHPQPRRSLRDVFERWRDCGTRSKDTLLACERALKLFESLTDNKTIEAITRADGDSFRAILAKQPVSSKTTKDRFTWVKALLRYAAEDLGWLEKHPWVGLKVSATGERTRRIWTQDEIDRLLGSDIFKKGIYPRNWNAGGAAAYWLPLLGLLTGARLSELAQLKVADICLPTLRIQIQENNNEQRLKTPSARRSIPLHSELIRLGFIDYVSKQARNNESSLWSELPKRENKAGGFFSVWFSAYKKECGIGTDVDFHSFRHTVRTKLVQQRINESVIDKLLGHAPTGSTGARTYTHVDEFLSDAVESIDIPAIRQLAPIK